MSARPILDQAAPDRLQARIGSGLVTRGRPWRASAQEAAGAAAHE